MTLWVQQICPHYNLGTLGCSQPLSLGGHLLTRAATPCRFYEKVWALHQDPGASVDNPLSAFSLIKRLSSDWPSVVYSSEATENSRGTAGMCWDSRTMGWRGREGWDGGDKKDGMEGIMGRME